MRPIYLINGPNLNLLGTREPGVYGTATLEDVEIVVRAAAGDVTVIAMQSNHEGAMIDAIHQAARDHALGIVMNPGGYSHTSVAIRDALTSVRVPCIEVHLSNVHAREEFRHKLVTAGGAKGIIAGLGIEGYKLAVFAIKQLSGGG